MHTYCIAEIGINHNGVLGNCLALIDAAVDAGCDAVKLQMFRAASLYPKSAGKLDWRDNEKSYSYDIYDAVKAFETPLEWIRPLQRRCREKNIDLLTSVFDEETLRTALRAQFRALKLASTVIGHLPLLEAAALSGLPLFLSTGGASLGEIETAVNTIRKIRGDCFAGGYLTLLHCSLQYPTPPESCNLGAIRTLSLAFPDLRIGYSDHTEDPGAAPYQAVRLGARVIEKHVTLDRAMPGPDHFFALDPVRLAAMVAAVREAEKDARSGAPFVPAPALHGDTRVGCTENQEYLRAFAYPTLFVKTPIKKDERIREENLAVLRPGKKRRGLDSSVMPLFREYSLHATKDLAEETSITWDCFCPPAPRPRIALFRADAHPAVGTGDLVSFIHFGRILEKHGWICRFCTRATDEAEAVLDSYAVSRRHMIATDLSPETEAALTASLAESLGARAVLVQVTDRPLDVYGAMRTSALKGCVSFERQAPCGFDFVWSWDVDAGRRFAVDAQPGTRFFLGPEYVVLPPEFLTQAETVPKRNESERRRLLVVMGGGADAANATGEVAERLKSIDNPLETTFVVGAAYERREELEATLADAPFPWTIRQAVTTMRDEYLAHDVCIAAGGLTASESAYLGVPTLLLAVYANQEARCAHFQAKGWARHLGGLGNWRLERIDLLSFAPSGKHRFAHRLDEVVLYLETAVGQTDGDTAG